LGLGGDGVLNKVKGIFKPKAKAIPETMEINDRRLLEMLGIKVDELNFQGENALKEATVFACIRILADSIGKLPVKVYQHNGTVDHYLTPLLKTRPNPWMSARDFFKALEVKRHLYGNAYAWLEFETKGKDAGKITGIYPLDSSKIEIYIDDIGLLPGK
jgi:phage portal protein BeeE